MEADDDPAGGAAAAAAAAAAEAAPPDEPVTRRELERALRGLVLADLDTRDALLQLAAQVVALTDELTRRLDGVEPRPAAPGTAAAAPPAGRTLEAAVEAATGQALPMIRATDAAGSDRVAIDPGEDKYAAVPADIPCAELIPLCGARCCALSFALSTADLDEGIVRWDHARPYLIRQRSDGYCVHNDPASHACAVHAARPRTCRVYDCRRDPRIWIDFERRIPVPEESRAGRPGPPPEEDFDLLERARARAVALRHERHAINASAGDPPPRRGPK